jgi:hypothetical protein
MQRYSCEIICSRPTVYEYLTSLVGPMNGCPNHPVARMLIVTLERKGRWASSKAPCAAEPAIVFPTSEF